MRERNTRNDEGKTQGEEMKRQDGEARWRDGCRRRGRFDGAAVFVMVKFHS